MDAEEHDREQREVAVQGRDGEAREQRAAPAEGADDTEAHRDGQQHERDRPRPSRQVPERLRAVGGEQSGGHETTSSARRSCSRTARAASNASRSATTAVASSRARGRTARPASRTAGHNDRGRAPGGDRRRSRRWYGGSSGGSGSALSRHRRSRLGHRGHDLRSGPRGEDMASNLPRRRARARRDRGNCAGRCRRERRGRKRRTPDPPTRDIACPNGLLPPLQIVHLTETVTDADEDDVRAAWGLAERLRDATNSRSTPAPKDSHGRLAPGQLHEPLIPRGLRSSTSLRPYHPRRQDDTAEQEARERSEAQDSAPPSLARLGQTGLTAPSARRSVTARKADLGRVRGWLISRPCLDPVCRRCSGSATRARRRTPGGHPGGSGAPVAIHSGTLSVDHSPVIRCQKRAFE